MEPCVTLMEHVAGLNTKIIDISLRSSLGWYKDESNYVSRITISIVLLTPKR